MFNIFICEDNEKQKNVILKHISNYVANEKIAVKNIHATASPIELLHILSGESTPGLYFLDIDLKSSMNGIDLARKIRKQDHQGAIVFVTADGNSPLIAIEHMIEPMGYIIKEDMDQVDGRIRECILNTHSKFILNASSPLANFSFILAYDTGKNESGTVIAIEQEKIIYFEISKEKKHIVGLKTEDGNWMLRGSLSKVLEQLDSKYFFRCHKSFIVNIRKIRAIHKKGCKIEMDGGDVIDVNARKIKKITTLMGLA